jgi:hypothetical protein
MWFGRLVQLPLLTTVRPLLPKPCMRRARSHELLPLGALLGHCLPQLLQSLLGIGGAGVGAAF